MQNLFQNLQKILKNNNSEIFFIHPDIFRLSVLTRSSLILNSQISQNIYLRNHIEFLKELLEGRDMWFPAFNFNFLQNGFFDLNKSKSDRGGSLAEYFRLNSSNWRTMDPVFSITGLGKNPFIKSPKNKMEAYGEDSFFSRLEIKGGSLFCYGAKESTLSHIHYIEKLCQVPYRYNKIFKGEIYKEEAKYQIEYKYYVKPISSLESSTSNNLLIGYDWKKLIKLMHDNDIIKSSKGNLGHVVKISELVSIISEKIKLEPLYLLDSKSHKWISKKLEELGRPFEIEDFEKA